MRSRLGMYWQHQLTLDTLSGRYVARELVGGQDVRYPLTMDLETYRLYRLREDVDDNWRSLREQRARARGQQRRGGLGFNIVVPGGQQSAFTTIFGRPEVDLRVNGQAMVNAGFDYRKSDQQIALTGSASQLDPQFKQDLRLGIVGTIGDKLRVDVNWDTNNQFDYQNQLKLQYTGYEDDIIQLVEAGNVMLQTPSRLIRGGQSLFGIKSELQLGNLYLTTVASQQEGQTSSLSIDGGAETTEFNLRATDYEESTHFFLGYYFRNNYEPSLAQPPNLIVFDNFDRIESIEVWKLQRSLNPEDENVRQVVALVDLGENPEMLPHDHAARTNLRQLPSNTVDQYQEGIREHLRTGANLPNYLENNVPQPLQADDYQVGTFRRLQQARDFDFDPVLGYLSLRQSSLADNEALAVAYRYRAGGVTYTVGDFSTETGGGGSSQQDDRLVLKLLRPADLKQPSDDGSFSPAAWHLELRNIYRLPSRGLNPDNFDLQIFHDRPGSTPSKTIRAVGGSSTLLQMLGLDRLNADRAPNPNDRFDFLVGITIDPGQGRLMFPYLQPFGSRMEQLIAQSGSPPEQANQLREELVFRDLYTKKRTVARRNTRQDVYAIQGSYRGNVQEFYDLRAFAGLIEGSVRVTAGGVPLQEGSDFRVDYQGGTVTIINPAFLTAGRNIEINYEQNSFFNMQKKTLLGLRADYSLGEQVAVGSTVMTMSQKSPVDKYRIGEEPVSNTIYGFDGNMRFEPEWLTRLIDRLPLIQTRTASTIQLSGEFAQLIPGSTQTSAFQRSRRDLQRDGIDFKADELAGVSYIDDFEGFSNTFSLRSPNLWQIASAPQSTRRVPNTEQGLTADSLRTNWRATLGWYQINANIIQRLGGNTNDPVTGLVGVRELYDREVRGSSAENTISTLDVYFDPQERGPYNYTRDLGEFLDHPKDAWGAMIQRVPEGYTDFSLQNIEFIELIFRPHSEAGDAGEEAELIFDLGQISEDVIPNGRLNSEDGLCTGTFDAASLDAWGRIPRCTPNNAVDTNNDTRWTEDLGIDGLVSFNADGYPPELTEHYHFRDFLNSLSAGSGGERYEIERRKAEIDPSADDYRYWEDSYFNDPLLYPGGASIQQRFSRYFSGQELNALETQRLSGDASRRGLSRRPDTEDLNNNGTLDTENSYYEYRIPLSRERLNQLAAAERAPGEYLVERLGDNQDWFLVRIPVRQYTDRIGSIQDFSLIRAIRMWTTGHTAPITMRFARLELVGSQWQKSEQVLEETDFNPFPNPETGFTVESINDEENQAYISPNGIVTNETRGADGVPVRQREQAMLMRIEQMHPHSQSAVFKTYSQGLDLLKYSNLRMFSHFRGTIGGHPITDRDQLKLFVRLGANESADFYEYEQPLTPAPPGAIGADAIWQTNQMVNGEVRDLNSMNIVLGTLNQLKVSRDNAEHPLNEIFWTNEHPVEVSPRVDDFAPPGTRIGIKGNPSLGRVNSIVIGVRTPEGAEHVIDAAEVWVNELRVSGYDETNGWSAIASADIRLADVANVRASFQQQSDGFGSLESTLGERDQNAINNWSVSTDFFAHRLIPERFGWTIPVSVQVQSNTTTPRFSPTRGDVRVQELVDQAMLRSDIDEDGRRWERDRIIQEAQTHRGSRSFSTRVSKQGSDAWLIRNTLDALNFTYTYSDQDARSPSLQVNDNWQWNTSVNYRVAQRRPRTTRPLWFLEDVPVVGILGDLRWAYLPQSVALTGSARRTFSETRDRPNALRSTEDPLPEAVEFPLRQQHAFTHQRGAAIQYNPFQFLNLSYDASSQQSLNILGADTLYTVHTNDARYDGISLQEAVALGHFEDASCLGQSCFETRQLMILPADRVFSQVLRGNPNVRADNYDQRFSGTLRPNFGRSGPLSFLQVQDITYSVRYGWQNGALGNNRGARVSNTMELRGGLTVRPIDFWRKFDWFRSMEEAQRAAERESQARQRAREQQRNQPRPENGQAAESAEEDGRPLIDFRALLRRTALAVTGIRDLNVTYTGTLRSSATNVGRPYYDGNGRLVEVGTNYTLWQALRGNAPPVAYRFGLERRIPLDQRIFEGTQVTDVLSDQHRIQARTTLQPSQALQINLNWTGEWEDGQTYSYQRLMNEIETTLTETGRNRASVWVFGASYLDMFQRQWDTYRGDRAAATETDLTELGDEDGDGRIVLTNRSVVEDFQNAFMVNVGFVDGRGLLPFPLPGWNVTYNGLGRWPILRALVQSATLRHGYSGDYTTDFTTNAQGGQQGDFAFNNLRITFPIPHQEVGGIRINERYQPLIGLDLNFRNRLATQIAFSKSNAYSLSASNLSVSESKTNEFTFSANYQKQGMNIPFLSGRRLNNRLGLTLTLSRSFTRDQRYSLDRAIRAAARESDFVLESAIGGDFVTLVTGATRTTITPQISYQFSNRVNANFSLKYEQFDSEDSRQPSATNVSGGFNVRVSIAN
jgi:cell surface protein SprA